MHDCNRCLVRTVNIFKTETKHYIVYICKECKKYYIDILNNLIEVEYIYEEKKWIIKDREKYLFVRYKKALGDLTVGGSEYYNSPERCASDIRERLESQREQIKNLIKERRKIYAIPILGWLVRKIMKEINLCK